MTGFGLSRRIRSFLLWTARLALVVYLVQLSAVDHWQSSFGDVVGVEGSSAHVQHCHGAGDCSTGGGAEFAANVQPMTLPAPGVARFDSESTAPLEPQAAFVSPPSEPPRAA